MTNCCMKACPPLPGRTACPACGEPALGVKRRTLLHQLINPQALPETDSAFYFCLSPDCELVYFSADGERYPLSMLREIPGQKSTQADRLLCYCFNISAAQIAAEPCTGDDSPSKNFVIEQTRTGQCACEVRNPSGRCCLADFPAPPPSP